MNLDDALAKATANGWSDDSAWTRSTVAAQVSTERDGFLASVVVGVNGVIRWGVSSLDGKTRYQRGLAKSFDAALDACNDSITTSSGTLF
jgi:hypothetical protein